MICQMMIRVMTVSKKAPAVSMVFIRKSRIFSTDFPNPDEVLVGTVPAGFCAAFNPKPPIHYPGNTVQVKMERTVPHYEMAFPITKLHGHVNRNFKRCRASIVGRDIDYRIKALSGKNVYSLG